MPDCCAYVRAHLAPPGEEKVRAVWGYPMYIQNSRSYFCKTINRGLPDSSEARSLGFETAMGGTRRVLSKFGQRRNISALDFSCFDKTVPIKN